MSAPKKKEEKEIQFPEDQFMEEYKALCDKHQCGLVITPRLKARDDGTWSIVVDTSIKKLPQQNVRSQVQEVQ